ncbi:MAG: hypothetical protein NTV49_15350 [Kiritimatiellaeota bacterium]|nr:hypothetical protein [Kiritimatiellota bacterium]
MTLRILGEHPLALNEQGQLKSRIGTIFPKAGVLVTLPGIHATQRMAYVQDLNERRRAQGLPPLTPDEEVAEWRQSVDLVMEGPRVLIRPDPNDMPLAFAADEILQRLIAKQRIRFLMLTTAEVRQAIKQRGECWRINPLPQTPAEMEQMVRAARIRIHTDAVYYYNNITGTKFLTLNEFRRLEDLPPEGLARALREIHDLSGRHNRMYNPEVDFFAAPGLNLHDWLAMDPAGGPLEQAQQAYQTMLAQFRQAVPPALQEDQLDNMEWRNRMVTALLGQRDQSPPEEILLGLSPEFFMQIEWLAGGCIENDELIFDPLFDEFEKHPADPELRLLCDDRARGIIFNTFREFNDVEYINIGRVATSLAKRSGAFSGRRGVYLAEMKRRGETRALVRILRVQKWGIWEHLDENKDLCWAVMESEDYTEYILDRRLGCRQLGMNLPTQVTTRRVMEQYNGANRQYAGRLIWATYVEREYVSGIASDKIPPSCYAQPEFGRRLAGLLGRAAASNIVVGRMTADTQQVLFDDGDEVIIEDSAGLPADLIVSDHTGTFTDFKTDLVQFAAAYAQPVNCRRAVLPDPAEFARIYLDALLQRLTHIQQEYRRRQRAFDTLFKLHSRNEPGAFAFRWERVLERLDHTDPAALVAAIGQKINLTDEPKQ